MRFLLVLLIASTLVGCATPKAPPDFSAFRAAAPALGVVAYPSLGNFVLMDVKKPAQEVYEKLLREGVIVRPMAVWGLSTHLRISIGTDAQNERCLSALRNVLS